MASSFIGLVSTSASAEVTQGYQLTYNEEKSTDTEKYIDVTAVGLDNVASFTVQVSFPANTVTAAEFVANDTKLTVIGGDADEIANGSYMFGGFTTDSNGTALALGELKLTVPASTENFDVELSTADCFLSDVEGKETSFDAEKITVIGVEPAPTDVPSTDPVTKGFQLTYNEGKSTDTEKYINVTAVGLENVASFTVQVSFPANTVTAAEFTAVDTKLTVIGGDTDAIANGSYMFGGFTTDSNGTALELGELKLTVPAGTSSFLVELMAADCFLSDVAGTESAFDPCLVLVKGSEPVSTEVATETATEVPSAQPTEVVTAAPYETTRPARRVPTEAPEATIPAATEDSSAIATTAPVTKGFQLAYDEEKSTDTEKYINVTAVGLENVASFTVQVAFPKGAVTAAEFAANDSKVTVIGGDADEIANGSYMFGGFTTESNGTGLELGALKLTVPAGTDTFAVSLGGSDLFLSDVAGTEAAFDACTIAVLGANAGQDEEVQQTEAAETETPTPAPFTGDETVKFSDLAKTDGIDAMGFDITVSGTYGKDYAAYMDGKILTEDDFLDMVHGYTAAPAELIKDMTIAANDGVTIKVMPATQTAEQAAKDPETWTLYPGLEVTKTITKATTAPTDKPTASPTPTPPAGGGSSGSGSTGGSGSRSSGSGSSTIASSAANPVTGGVIGSSVSFQDLSSVPWAVEAINALVSMGIINGRSNTIFDPNATVTRAEFTKMVCATFGIAPSTTTTQTFTDVYTSDWYFGYVEAAAANGIVYGVSDTEFDPNAYITREQMAAMLYRAVNAVGRVLRQGTAVTFADAYAVSDYANDAVSALSAAGVINGVGDDMFDPQGNATRAQAACIIYQYLQSLAG